MDNENAVGINLSSRLDINSHDMLVSVQEPKFQFNRQKFQGSLLQTSVRYEADGWFAGWWGHNFDFVSTAENTVTPPLDDDTFLSVIRRQDENNNSVYVVKHKDIGLTYTFNPTLFQNWVTGSGTIVRSGGATDVISITNGKTNKGNNFSVTIDPYTGALISFVDIDNVELSATSYKSGENIRLEVKRNSTLSSTDYVSIRTNNVPVLAGHNLSTYEYNGVASIWNNLFKLEVSSTGVATLTPVNPAMFAVVAGSVNITDYNIATEKVVADIKDLSIDNLVYSFNFQSYWVQDLFANAAPLSDNMSQQVTATENSMFGDLLAQGSPALVYNNSCVYRYGLPIWIQHRLDFDYGITFADDTPLPVHLTNFRWRITTTKDNGSEIPIPLEIIGFKDLLAEPDLTIWCYATDAASSYNPVTVISTGVYEIVQPDNPRYSILKLNIEDTHIYDYNLFVPTTFQPYIYTENPAYDPRPVVWAGADIQIYGLTNTGSKAKQTKQNPDKYAQAAVAATIADIDAIPDGMAIDPFVPEYEHTSGIIGQDVITNPFGYQPDPTQANYDPRPVVHAINGVLDPAVLRWTNGQAATTNTAQVVLWYVTTPAVNYTRYWLKTADLWWIDWDPSANVTEYWSQYYRDLPVPNVPVPSVIRNNPYADESISGVIPAAIDITTIPDTTLPENQPIAEDGQITPPQELPYIATLEFGNFKKKSILHAMKDITGTGNNSGEAETITTWSWAFKLTRKRTITYKAGSRDYTSSTTTYYNSNGEQTTANAELVWKKRTDNFPGMTIYDRDPESPKESGQSHIAINDTWVLYLKCKNGEASFPIPTTDFTKTDQDGSNYFQVALISTGNFRNNQILMELFTRAVWFIPSYTDAPYSDNYRVLNNINLTRNILTAVDPGMFTGTETTGAINIPLCVPGYAVSEITTPSILNSDLSAFEIKNNIQNIDSRVNQYMWRIDKTGNGGATDFSLDLVTAKLLSVQANNNTLYVQYDATGKGPFYQLAKQPYTTDYSTGAITGYQDFSYPDWIYRNLSISPLGVGSYTENDYCKLYIPGAQSATVIANLTVLLKELDFIDSIDTEQKITSTPYNGTLFEDIQMSYVVSPPAIDPDTESHDQTLELYLDNTLTDVFTATYNPDTTELETSPAPGPYHWAGGLLPVAGFINWTYVAYTPGTVDEDKKVTNITVQIQNLEAYTLTFKRTFALAYSGLMLPASIAKQENHKITFTPLEYGILDLTTNKLIDSTVVTYVQTDTISEDVIKVYVAVNNSALVYFKPTGFVSRSDQFLIYESYSGNYNIVFTYKGEEHTLHIDTRASAEQYLSYTCTDIRTGKITEVYRRELDDIMMFVKQFWSGTVDTENFWWVDSEHVLQLEKHTLTLHKKIGLVDGKQSLHDWDGDNWEVDEVGNRATLISTEDMYYSVSSAYNTSGILFKLRHVNNKVQLLYIDPLEMDWDTPVWKTVDIEIEQTAFGVALSHGKIASYGPINIDSLITTTKISSTTIGKQDGGRILLIGIKQNNGLGQWCLKVNVGSGILETVIVGYGCVGPKGELTGGQIPIDYCDVNGFNGVVETFDALPAEVSKIDEVPKLIVGTSSQQWFIQRRMLGIISHLIFEPSTGAHVPISLYLNNNVDMLLHWATCRGARLQDVMPQSLNIATLFGSSNTAINILMGVISPSFFYLSIFYAVFVGIATSMGTYSYTWRNSNEIKARDAESLTDQDISFAKYTFNKSLSINNRGMHTWAQIIIHMIKTLPETVAQVVVNKSQGQSAVDDSVGRKFSQLFEETVSTAISTAIDSSGFNVRAQTVSKHQHSLTSFYSINDKIECHAGPGFVNHNLKAQCTAQSMQDIQFDGKQLGFFSVLTKLTSLVLGLQNLGLKAAYEALERAHDNTAQQETNISPGATINWGYFVSLAISAGMLVTRGIILLNEMILENLDGIVESFGGKTDAFLNNWLSAHTPTQEGLHSYGNKSMSFFWPAFGIDKQLTYTDEQVAARLESVELTVSLTGALNAYLSTIDEMESTDNSLYIYPFEAGLGITNTSSPESARIPIVKCIGSETIQQAPENMAIVEGTTAFLSRTAFKNEQIGVGPPAFGPPMIHDFMIDKQWSLGYTAGAGAIISVSCDDTKLIDGPPSNVIITDDFCGIASSYIALEIKKTFDDMYLRPTLVTANAIGLNINRINCVHDAKAYHAFDGQVNRIVNWVGGSGMDKELLYQQYLFQMNDHFKRSNIFPPAQFFGSFQGPPVVAIRSYEIVSNTIIEQTSGLGFGTNTPGENRNLQRFSTCVFSELLSSLPTTIRTLAPYKLRVNDGVTCLVTELRNTNTRYKAPTSVDFNIGTRLYRKTEEYIVEITEQSGVVMTETRTPSAGLEFIGPTMVAAYFYSPATKLYYEYAGGTELQKQDILNRFRSVREGRWDFINQEVIFSAQHGYTGEEMVLRLDGDVRGEVWPPNKTIYNERSGFKIYSCAGGLVYQGPKRFIVSRFVTLEHMLSDISRNKRRWKKVAREEFIYERDYGWQYDDLYTETPVDAVAGWTHNPFLVVTSMLGTSEDADNKFEWALTFAWSDTMEHIFEQNEYVTVNVMAETVTQGGVVRQRPTHLFLSKELFTRSANAGYYTIKFQSNAGTGNRERLFIWSDGIIALEDLKVAVKQISATRTQPLVTQVDLERLVEL